MRRASVFAALILSVFIVQPASAVVIGVRGGDSGSPPATNSSWFEMTECAAEDLEGLFCFVYSNPLWTEAEEDFIYALDFRFQDEFEDLFSSDSFFVHQLSDFQGILPVDDFTIRLCDDSTPEGQAACLIGGIDPPIFDQFFTVFSDDARFVQILAVNLQPNQIPEPATLLLLALGITTVAGRRLRNRRN